MLELLQLNSETLRATIVTYAPYLLLIAFVLLSWASLKWIRSGQDEAPTINVLGYHPSMLELEWREIPKEGNVGVWKVQDGQDVTFKPKQEFAHSTPQGPAWLIDLTDGRCMKIPEPDQVARTTGQELTLARKDTSLNQTMDTGDEKSDFYLKIAAISAPIIILLLVVMLVVFLTGGS